MMNWNSLDKIAYKDSEQFFLIAGPCVVKSKDLCAEIAERMIQLSKAYEIFFSKC